MEKLIIANTGQVAVLADLNRRSITILLRPANVSPNMFQLDYPAAIQVLCQMKKNEKLSLRRLVRNCKDRVLKKDWKRAA